jgi:small nuclear ribonucleoprotein (snRNP)-like protein
MAGDPTGGGNNKRAHQTLGSLLKYFEEMPLRVELKNGKIYGGVLETADANMALTLREAMEQRGRQPASPHHRHRQPHSPPPPSTSTTTTDRPPPQTFPLLQIRGSAIRYVHFPDEVDLAAVIQAGIDRARQAANRYQRGVRKGPKQPPS